MVKPEWGTKRTCPKCATRFYDLGNDDPVHCIECGTDWVPEPVLKSKQPLAFEAAAPVKEKAKDDDLEAEDLAIDEDEEPSADDEVDLTTDDDDLGVERGQGRRRQLRRASSVCGRSRSQTLRARSSQPPLRSRASL